MIVRAYRPYDWATVHRICVATADAGEPADRILRHPELAAYVFADPYLLLQPDLAFVAEFQGTVLGYVVAALDSEEFYARWRLEWAPRFASSHPDQPRVDPQDGDSQLRAFLHRPRLMLLSERERYPSHLHINLLPGARRRGTGRRLLSVLFHELARAGSLGVQLGVRADNTGAQAFYRSMGMRQLRSEEQAPVRFGRPLRERPTPFGTMGAD